MNRRSFLSTAALSGGAIIVATHAQAEKPVVPQVCTPSGLDFISAEATYHSVYEHFHLLSIPVSALVEIPDSGYTTRTTPLDQGSLEEDAFMKFIRESGLPEKALRHHSHEVKFTKEDLERIAGGEKDVKITVLTPKKNLAHYFYFTATPSALVKIRKARENKA